ncbi:patatin-like phospholipase family protein [Ilumatobacter nonamiensis]|uniref:patatin-like phospholipase family protein n=1 Tax=Ilumatobacter nonamiensis TaxID=467093 RepID=UPI0003479833|nr:patatin-like phospholipase family protein [Ilumatobacter nonamiensis]
MPDPYEATLVESLPRPIAFVLGGGGSLGAAQVGMLQALHDRNIHADLVTGTSIGALNGAIVAADPIGAASRLSHVWNNLDTDAILPGGVVRRIWTLWRSKTSIYDTPNLAQLFLDEIGDVDIDDLEVPFAAMALDVETSLAVALTSGPVISAALASSAIPGVFPSVHRDGRDLYDGGLVTNVPVLQALGMGAKSLVVLDCAFPDQQIKRPTTMPETVFYSMMVQMRQQVLRELPVAAESVPVVYVPGSAPVIVSPLDFSLSASLMRDSYGSARKFLETVTVDGPGLYRTTSIEDALGD